MQNCLVISSISYEKGPSRISLTSPTYLFVRIGSSSESKIKSYSKLSGLKDHVNIAEAMSGEKGAERASGYSTPMAEGLSFNYAAKQVDETVLAALAELADEAQLIDKFEELYNGAVINTGEKRMVLHHLARRQLGNPVVVDGVDKRE